MSTISFSELFGEAVDVLEWRLSGGASNTNPFLSLGGIMSNTKLVPDRVSNLFDIGSEAELIAGFTDYRHLYLFNKSTSETVKLPTIIYSPKDEFVSIQISLRPVDFNNQLLENEITSPDDIEIGSISSNPLPWMGCTENRDTTKAFFDELPPQSKKGVWFKRTVPFHTERKVNVRFGLTVLGKI